MATSVVSFKAALVSRLAALPALTGVQVSWGNPYPDRMQTELVMVGVATPANSPRETPKGLGSSARDEEYTIEVIVSVIGRPRDTQQALAERAFALADAIQDSLAAWRTEDLAYGGDISWLTFGSPAEGEAMRVEPETQQPIEREASVRFAIEIVARVNT